MIPKTESKLEFIIPQETSWHFERKLKPDDRKVDNYVLIKPGAADVLKVLKAYSHHPVAAYNIASIEIMYNEALNRQFFGHMTVINKRKGNSKYQPSWRNKVTGEEKNWREATHAQLESLSKEHADANLPNVMLLPLWHGTSDAVSDHIFSGGYGIFTSNDPSVVTDDGFFGKGIYTAHEAEYAFRSYAQKHGDQAVLLLNWVSIFEAYPVIDGDMPKLRGKMGGYDQCDTHFVPVRSDIHPHTDTYYPCAPDQTANYHEIVVFAYQQCLPRYRVKLIENNPQPPLDDTASVCYQMGLDALSLYQYGSVANGFEEAWNAGHPGASVRLHWLYSGASGVVSGESEALKGYQTLSISAFERLKSQANFRGENDQESQFTLGWCYQQGLGCEKNLAKAAQYYWIAAVQGHRDAAYQLGACCASGRGVKKDMELALKFYEQAARQGHVHAHYVLGQCYGLGLGCEVNATQAMSHQQAAQKGKHPLLAGLGTASLVTVVSPAPVVKTTVDPKLAQEIQQLKQQLEQQASELKAKGVKLSEKEKQLEQAVDVAKGKTIEIAQLNQVIAKEQQVSRSKDELLMQKVSELRDKDGKLVETEKARQQAVQEGNRLSSELDQTGRELNQLKVKWSEQETLRSKLESALSESKDREMSLALQLKEYEKQAKLAQTQSPAKKGFLTDFFNPAPSPSPSRSGVALNATQQKKQNELVEACLKGDVVLVKQLESQGTSLFYPNAEGLYPLVASVYGCSLETVRYVESKLKEEAVKQWGEVDVEEACKRLEKNTPTQLGSNATYGDVANWYVKHQGSSWCAYYDAACLKHLGYSNWGGWDGSYKDVKWGTMADLWHGDGLRCCCILRWRKERRHAGGRGALWSGYGQALDAGAEIDGMVIKEIREQLDTLKKDVVTKAKRSSSVVGQPKKS